MILEVDNASFSYDGITRQFDGITFSLREGEVLSLLGRNGTGKSTLIKCIMNLLRLQNGRVSLNGQDVAGMRPEEIARQIGYVPQVHNTVFPFTALDFVLMGRAPHIATFAVPKEEDYAKADEAFSRIGITHLREKSIAEISGGESQMVMIARALAQEPAMLILDEPTSHLDFGNQMRVITTIDRLAAGGIAVLMSTHFPDHGFMISHSVAVLQGGRMIAYGRAEDVITRENLLTAYGIDVCVRYIEEAGRRVCIPLHTCSCRDGKGDARAPLRQSIGE
ncbi:ABC transporter ATP-binding protein [Methanoculleus sp. FWC-SCC1]|uniref:ABC transporter ATP-binding protein n=1 Tax=Methanoculleus frigidifontis TaxID=2584085 RepID=A0ABT8MA97_9EURY|nr:ABC transporter ATP-binding protein [Methanoculleus sp. FWC-SCC1]MDN7024830.1 ABC transporter ATP-binding protein [Methanoculleus sp. FWC-SCC1]